MNEPIYIYTMKEFGEDEVRYVGQTIHPVSRYYEHLKKNKHSGERKYQWIEEATLKGKRIFMEIIEECDDMQVAADRENFWIDYYRSLGHRLTNTAKATAIPRGWSRGKSTVLVNPIVLHTVEQPIIQAPVVEQEPQSPAEIVALWIEGWDGFRKARRTSPHPHDAAPYCDKIRLAEKCAKEKGIVPLLDEILLGISNDYPTFRPMTKEEEREIDRLDTELDVPYWMG